MWQFGASTDERVPSKSMGYKIRGGLVTVQSWHRPCKLFPGQVDPAHIYI